MTDNYSTITSPSEGFFRDRGSKFLAYAWPVFSESDIREKLEWLRKEHPKARHHCYAWRLGLVGQEFRANDDGEPSGTAGRPILGQIDSFGLTNVLIVVVRYFGGTLLGASGLINAYKVSTQDALENAELVERTVENVYDIRFSYAIMNDVMAAIKKTPATTLEQHFDEEPHLRVCIRQSEAAVFIGFLEKIEGLECAYIQSR